MVTTSHQDDNHENANIVTDAAPDAPTPGVDVAMEQSLMILPSSQQTSALFGQSGRQTKTKRDT